MKTTHDENDGKGNPTEPIPAHIQILIDQYLTLQSEYNDLSYAWMLSGLCYQTEHEEYRMAQLEYHILPKLYAQIPSWCWKVRSQQ